MTGKVAYSFRFDTAPSRFLLVVTPGLGVGSVQHSADFPGGSAFRTFHPRAFSNSKY